VQTDRTIPNSRPDIIICDNEKETYLSIDIAISGYRNVIEKEAEKILKQKDLTTELQDMWNVNPTVTISKQCRKYPINIPAKRDTRYYR
jgi:hypothetical protein